MTLSQRTCSVWWVSTHYRLRAVYDDERAENVYNYNRGMRAFFDAGNRCGPVNYIDVYVWGPKNRGALVFLHIYTCPSCSGTI